MTDEETPGLRSRSAPSVTNRHKTTDQRRVMLPSAAKKTPKKSSRPPSAAVAHEVKKLPWLAFFAFPQQKRSITERKLIIMFRNETRFRGIFFSVNSARIITSPVVVPARRYPYTMTASVRREAASHHVDGA
ncbi:MULTISPECIES: hypothetical protein [Enterobacteriaceae]|uniref:Uncharacterized protein n=1 Tax=Raoultella lignicola TaxID=3040939 RepID=A0ABU9F7K8_9ENTR|nr:MULTISPECIES: hypothetical protein [Enterobacteriaceae]MRT49358.1 hypothetical protein [Raoultella sp. RIT712]QNK07352.1 hypothetical protein HF679_21715 [Enterobacter sp. JUb54]